MPKKKTQKEIVKEFISKMFKKFDETPDYNSIIGDIKSEVKSLYPSNLVDLNTFGILLEQLGVEVEELFSFVLKVDFGVNIGGFYAYIHIETGSKSKPTVKEVDGTILFELLEKEFENKHDCNVDSVLNDGWLENFEHMFTSEVIELLEANEVEYGTEIGTHDDT